MNRRRDVLNQEDICGNMRGREVGARLCSLAGEELCSRLQAPQSLVG